MTNFLIFVEPCINFRTKVACTNGNHNVYIIDIRTKKNLKTLYGHKRTPWTVAFHPTNNNILASGCLSGEVRVWNLEDVSNEYNGKFFTQLWWSHLLIESFSAGLIWSVAVAGAYGNCFCGISSKSKTASHCYAQRLVLLGLEYIYYTWSDIHWECRRENTVRALKSIVANIFMVLWRSLYLEFCFSYVKFDSTGDKLIAAIALKSSMLSSFDSLSFREAYQFTKERDIVKNFRLIEKFCQNPLSNLKEFHKNELAEVSVSLKY